MQCENRLCSAILMTNNIRIYYLIILNFYYMKKKHFLYWKNGGLLIASIFIFLVSCKGNGDAPQTYDPSKPVEFDEFLPKEGGVGTKLVIRGANFG